MTSTTPITRKRISRIQIEVVDGLWTSSEVMKYLNISRKKLSVMISKGELPAYRIGEVGDLRFRVNDVKNCCIPLPGTGKLVM
jgi:excisionase family DNA binding protein